MTILVTFIARRGGAGRGTLRLQALEIPGEQAMDFRLLTLRRLD